MCEQNIMMANAIDFMLSNGGLNKMEVNMSDAETNLIQEQIKTCIKINDIMTSRLEKQRLSKKRRRL